MLCETNGSMTFLDIGNAISLIHRLKASLFLNNRPKTRWVGYIVIVAIARQRIQSALAATTRGSGNMKGALVMDEFVPRWNKLLLLTAAIAAISMPAFAQQAPATAANSEPALQEIIVTGSRIAAPNAVSTSPINVISAKDIQVYGKTDISDIMNLLPQNFNNALGQDYGNGTSGLLTAGVSARALPIPSSPRPHPTSTKFRPASSIVLKSSPAAHPRPTDRTPSPASSTSS